jgi:hypothetical protein
MPAAFVCAAAPNHDPKLAQRAEGAIANDLPHLPLP